MHHLLHSNIFKSSISLNSYRCMQEFSIFKFKTFKSQETFSNRWHSRPGKTRFRKKLQDSPRHNDTRPAAAGAPMACRAVGSNVAHLSRDFPPCFGVPNPNLKGLITGNSNHFKHYVTIFVYIKIYIHTFVIFTLYETRKICKSCKYRGDHSLWRGQWVHFSDLFETMSSMSMSAPWLSQPSPAMHVPTLAEREHLRFRRLHRQNKICKIH